MTTFDPTFDPTFGITYASTGNPPFVDGDAEVFLIDAGAPFGVSVRTIAGSASYPNDDFQMTGSGTQGTTTFTRSGGDPIADVGSLASLVVMEDASGNLIPNVTNGTSGSDVTLLYPLPFDAVVLHQGYRENEGIHLSPKGAEALAQYILQVADKQSYASDTTHVLYPSDVYSTSSVTDPSSNNVWSELNLGLNSFLTYNRNQNFFTGAASVCFGIGQRNIRVFTNAVDEGVTLDVVTRGRAGVFSMTAGSEELSGNAFRVEVLEGVSVVQSTDITNGAIVKIEYEHDGQSQLSIRVTRQEPGTTALAFNITSMQYTPTDTLSGKDLPTIREGSSVLLVGDSWFDAANVNGAPFDAEFRALHTGPVSNRAIAGSRIDQWLPNLEEWLDDDNPDVVVMHTGLNETVANTSAVDFWTDVRSAAETCTSRGVRFVIVSQGTVASFSTSTNATNLYYPYLGDTLDVCPFNLRYPELPEEFVDSASANEFTNNASVINNRNKVPVERVVERISDSTNLTPTGTSPADAWTPA